MTITVKHNRVAVGLRHGEWSVVYYEPIDPPDNLTRPHCAPAVGLYSQSKGDASEDDPIFGEVAWEHILNHEYCKTGAKAERLQLQRKLLYDAWRYLVATEPEEIATIKAQLQSSQKGSVLSNELDRARKARSSNIKQTRQRREKRRQRKIEQGLPAESVEKDDDEKDSGLGSEGEGGVENEEGAMPPPPPPSIRRPDRAPSGTRASLLSGSWSRSGSLSVDNDDDDVVEVDRSGSIAAAPRSRDPSSSARASGLRKRRNESSGTHSSRRRLAGSDQARSLFMTPVASQAQRQNDADGLERR